MIDKRGLIKETRKFAKENRTKSWAYLISTAVFTIAALIGATVNVHIIPQLFCSILAGLLIVRLFIMYHDYLHNAILSDSLLAKVFFNIYGMLILTPPSIWKRSHDYHHAHNSKLYTSSIGSYPLVTKEAFLAASKREQKLYLFARHPITIFFGYIFMFLWGMCIRSLISSPKRHLDSLFSMLIHFGIGINILLVFGLQGFLLGFLLPMMIAHALGAYLFYAQHNFPSATYKPKEEWDYFYAALYSSSYMRMNKLMHWFTGNIGYHHVHHVNSAIPFYNLPKAHEAIEALQKVGTTSLSPKDVYECFRLKVWDPEKGKMLTKRELVSS